jgi:phospholipase A1
LRLQVDYDNVESKFQLSFKTKVLQSFFLGHGDLWVGYTKYRIGRFIIMIYRGLLEVNYEPELILNFPLNLIFLVLIPEWLVWR